MRDRPDTPRRRASSYSCSRVRPFGRFVPDRCPPRVDGDFPRIETRERVRDSPERARSLFTVRAAISSARPVDAPRFFALALMCWY
jgi:hypothetical protein